MASSGTVGTTSLDLAKLIEKTYRRCGLPTGAITPELIDIAKENLYLLFQNWSNRGINLWAIDQPLIALRQHKATYDMPVGTIDVINALHRTLTTVTPSTTTVTATTIVAYFAASQTIKMFGLTTSATFTGLSFIFAGSTDGVTYATLKTASAVTYTNSTDVNWFAIDPIGEYQYYRITLTSAHTTTNLALTLVSNYSDLSAERYNRDNYDNLPNKTFEGTPSLAYWFNRQITPTMTMWPVPSVSTNCLKLITHRQVQDVGNDLTATVEIPDRWLDAVLWELAVMCSVEIPLIPADRITLCQQMTAAALSLADGEERDRAPSYLSVGIGVYNA